ncbi:hypothetical protein OFO10_02410 [Campylobacter sp. VBCF_06 NA8]|uniref:glycosyltransferase n=1 Tax=Campylobacter sp. VBCF_06 NA8 TaxID=2983822 RepID=UPI0022E9B8F2|nr:hypothetical protein [Campylobacter sp. VBCF_06 NA8]MDA3046008.1 hypothetical protein [Campylobacter sp. VBCF_06 NA8]
MKILFISTEIWSKFNPEGIVANSILQGFIKENHRVHVITNKEFDYTDKTVINSSMPEILEKIFKNIFGLEKILFVIKTILFLKKINLNEYDLVITRSEPISLHIVNLFLPNSIKKIAMFSDVGFLSPYYSKKYILKKTISKIIEKQVFKKCDIITHTNQYVIDLYIANGFDKEKFYIFPNPLNVENKIKQSILQKNSEIINLAYTGSFYGIRTPEKFFQYLKNQKNDNFKVYLIGAVRNAYYEQGRFGKIGQILKNKDLNKLKNLISKYSLEKKVEVLPFMSKNDLFKFIDKNIDILVNIDAPMKINLFLSSKVVDYLKFGCRILNVSSNGATVDFLRSVDVCKYVDYYTDSDFDLSDIMNNKDFLPNLEKIEKYKSENLVKNLLNQF